MYVYIQRCHIEATIKANKLKFLDKYMSLEVNFACKAVPSLSGSPGVVEQSK